MKLVEGDLFQAGTGGYAHYRIPGLVVTRQGDAAGLLRGPQDAPGATGARSTSSCAAAPTAARRGSRPGRSPTRRRTCTKNPVALAQKLAEPGRDHAQQPGGHRGRQDRGGPLPVLRRVRALLLPAQRRRRPDVHRAGRDHRRLRAVPPGVRLEGDGHRAGARHPACRRPAARAGLALHGHGRARPPAVGVVGDLQRRRRQDLAAGGHRGGHAGPGQPERDGGGRAVRRRVLLNIRHESEPHLRAVTVSPDGATRLGAGPVRPGPARAGLHGQPGPALEAARGRREPHPVRQPSTAPTSVWRSGTGLCDRARRPRWCRCYTATPPWLSEEDRTRRRPG